MEITTYENKLMKGSNILKNSSIYFVIKIII